MEIVMTTVTTPTSITTIMTTSSTKVVSKIVSRTHINDNISRIVMEIKRIYSHLSKILEDLKLLQKDSYIFRETTINLLVEPINLHKSLINLIDYIEEIRNSINSKIKYWKTYEKCDKTGILSDFIQKLSYKNDYIMYYCNDKLPFDLFANIWNNPINTFDKCIELIEILMTETDSILLNVIEEEKQIKNIEFEIYRWISIRFN